MLERELKRYSAYFKGWCQAFGEHKTIHSKKSGIDWLIAEDKVGLVLPKALIKPLYREVLLHEQAPTLIFDRTQVLIGSLEFELASKREKRALDSVGKFLESNRDFHVFLTSHLLYGEGSRIITFSSKKPLSIIYKEIGTMHLKFL
jgi:hypothetical protein